VVSAGNAALLYNNGCFWLLLRFVFFCCSCCCVLCHSSRRVEKVRKVIKDSYSTATRFSQRDSVSLFQSQKVGLLDIITFGQATVRARCCSLLAIYIIVEVDVDNAPVDSAVALLLISSGAPVDHSSTVPVVAKLGPVVCGFCDILDTYSPMSSVLSLLLLDVVGLSLSFSSTTSSSSSSSWRTGGLMSSPFWSSVLDMVLLSLSFSLTAL
jgi:hypothetical protein